MRNVFRREVKIENSSARDYETEAEAYKRLAPAFADPSSTTLLDHVKEFDTSECNAMSLFKRGKSSFEEGGDNNLEARDIQWLKEESQRTVSKLEYGFHGIVDLNSDVPEFEEDPDFTCQRFLRGFQQNRTKSLKNLQNYMLWRSVSETVEEDHITESLKAKKVFVLAHPDKTGGCCVLVIARHHNMFKTPIEETIKLLTYSLDKAIRSMDKRKGVTQGCIILDLEKIGWRALDVEALKHIMLFFQNFFPERVSKAIFWKAPKVFYALWSVVKPFLSQETRNKILFASQTQHLEQKLLLKHIPQCYGGQAQDDSLIPIEVL